jgi:hypothetical protein
MGRVINGAGVLLYFYHGMKDGGMGVADKLGFLLLCILGDLLGHKHRKVYIQFIYGTL